MAKIARKNMKVFGSTAGTNQIEQFGSLAAGLPVFTTDPETIQGIANYLTGWFAGVVGNNSPAIEDMNALCYLFAYQLAYIFQAGTPEWSSLTTYYIGSQANDGTGIIYTSIADNNLNNALTDTTKWQVASTQSQGVAITGSTSITTANNGQTLKLNVAAAANLQLPNPTLFKNQFVWLKDIAGNLGTFNVTLVRFAGESIEGLAANYVLQSNWGSWRLWCDGTNFYFVGS